MPAKDVYHETVKNALVKDGWVITRDPLSFRVGKRDMHIDLGAEELVSADKEGRKIAVEIKSFSGASLMRELEQAMGQYTLYKSVLARREPERVLYIAIRREVYEEAFADELGTILQADYNLRLIIFDATEETITQWIP